MYKMNPLLDRLSFYYSCGEKVIWVSVLERMENLASREDHLRTIPAISLLLSHPSTISTKNGSRQLDTSLFYMATNPTAGLNTFMLITGASSLYAKH